MPALAFFIQKRRAGTQGVARITHSIGNIRTISGYTRYAGCGRDALRVAGIVGWCAVICDLYYGRLGADDTERQHHRYAPWDDSKDPVQYAVIVCRMVDRWPP
ncbi:MAG: hypothetical protein M3Z04_03950 [Chloroflexota bacterium]|nr:hypothetical protein [Chloroflexota bacterium]